MTRHLVSDTYEVFDGIAFTEKACSPGPDRTEWTYNIGTVLAGSAYVSRPTSSPIDTLLMGRRCITMYAPRQEFMFKTRYCANKS